MKKNGFGLTLILVMMIAVSNLKGQENILPIDSLYMATIEKFYENADKFKNEIWPGMKLSPICLYRENGPAFLYNHPDPPKYFKKIKSNLYMGTQAESQLLGATQVEINGTLTAIVDYGLTIYTNPNEVYAELFHEMHHVYQRNEIHNIKHDNTATLLTYPENYKNDAIKLFEQNIFYKLCFSEKEAEFQQLLNQLYSCRLKRGELIGKKYLEYEKTVENMEGPAFYCQYKYHEKFSETDPLLRLNYSQKEFFGVLTTPFYGRNSLRYRHLASGMAMCYILDKHFNDWEKEYYASENNLYDFFISKFDTKPAILNYKEINYELTSFCTQKEVEKHLANYKKFGAQSGTKVTLLFKQSPQFDGFDPMNAESVNDSIILHKTLLKLKGKEDDELFITNRTVITFIDNEIWYVNKVIFFVPYDSLVLTHNKLTVNSESIIVKWSGEVTKESRNEIVLNCN